MALPALFAAAIAVTGITENPCPPPLPIPPELVAWRNAMYAPANHATIPPPASLNAYNAAYAEQRRADWPDLCHYRLENLSLKAQPAAARRVVFMGDSITQAWGYGDPALFRNGWVDRGISGQTTPQMLLRFSADVLALRPRVVHIMAGTNDVAGNTGPSTFETVEQNIAAMVTLAKAAGIKVVLAAVPPAARMPWAPQIAPAPVIAALNARLRALADREGVIFVDYAPAIGLPDGSMRPEMTLDGVHPSAAGYIAMAPLTRAAIARAGVAP
ncbi:lysophospholipase L1-like esterase [Sphingomonas vulcanisoli]|uniref:Lysophospholipase L1-like esterase n=1 Tax=Sphingomonas vulcanisoli TaxID=1658060 RepID=A0ABX0TX22_9SPHN|nr:GDSL-type esterase/lipase family protein [Sphingomonas vulcanisoli]NIJ08335.1 lysophospholipase L1-like esterase [Sphingomonas vulcanisoli]